MIKKLISLCIGRLRPSKSDTSHMKNSKKQQQSKSFEEDLNQPIDNNNNHATSPLSQSWNDMSQPLSKLKSVFSRLQTSNNEVNVVTTNNTAIKPKRSNTSNTSNTSSSVSHSEIKKKKKKSVIIMDLPPIERRKKKKSITTHAGMIYTALLSHVSKEFIRKVNLSTITFKDGIEHHDVFNGSVAVVNI